MHVKSNAKSARTFLPSIVQINLIFARAFCPKYTTPNVKTLLIVKIGHQPNKRLKYAIQIEMLSNFQIAFTWRQDSQFGEINVVEINALAKLRDLNQDD